MGGKALIMGGDTGIYQTWDGSMVDLMFNFCTFQVNVLVNSDHTSSRFPRDQVLKLDRSGNIGVVLDQRYSKLEMQYGTFGTSAQLPYARVDAQISTTTVCFWNAPKSRCLDPQ